MFDEVLSTTPDSFLMIDREGRFAYSSPAALSNASLTAQQVIGKTWSELGFPEEMGARSDRTGHAGFRNGEAVTIEMAFPTAQGCAISRASSARCTIKMGRSSRL